MILFYFIWNLIFYFISNIHIWVEKNFLIKNNPFFIYKRNFKYISYFEKLFLVFFYKTGWFEKSIANLYRKKDIIDYRRNKYPLISSFHLIHDETKYDYTNISIKFLVKLFIFNSKNKFFFKKLNFFLKNNSKNKFISFLILVKIIIKKYFNFNSKSYYYDLNENNLIKFFRLFFLYFLKSQYKFTFYDLNKWNDWYIYNFNNKFVIDLKLNKIKKYTANKKQTIKEKLIIIKYFLISYEYRLRIKKFNKFFNLKKVDILYFNLNLNNFFKIKINKNFSYLMKYYKIKFSESSITKYLNTKNLKNYTFYYLRKNRIFNKGRYSRNRQLYRTGVYWCLWLNIIMVYGLYFIFYRFTFNFGYFWWGVMILAYSTIFSRILKYNFFNINYLFKEFYKLVCWYGAILNSLYSTFFFYIDNYIKNNNKINKIFIKNKNFINFFYEKYYYYFSFFYKKLILDKKNKKNTFIWQGMKNIDKSFFKHKTLVHWLGEIFRLIITK